MYRWSASHLRTDDSHLDEEPHRRVPAELRPGVELGHQGLTRRRLRLHGAGAMSGNDR